MELKTAMEEMQTDASAAADSGKLRAFGVHLGISAAVVGAAILVIFVFWYPPPYFQIIGTWIVLRVLVGVDLVLGPLLTLIVFRRGKPRLLLDMGVIVVIQLTALIYGLTVIYQERPFAAVFVVDRFEILTRPEVDVSRAEPSLRRKPLRGPVLAVALVPQDPEERMALIEQVLAGQPDIQFRPQYWRPYDEQLTAVLTRARPLADLVPPPNPGDQALAQQTVARYGDDDRNIRFLPVVGKAGPATLLLDGSTGRPLRAVAINPWPAIPAAAGQ